MFEKLLSWLTTAFDVFALGAAVAIGLRLVAPETFGSEFLQSAWMCIGIAAVCWAVLVSIATANAQPGAGAVQTLQIDDVRTAEREGQDGVHFCLDHAGGRHEFIISRGALQGLIDGDFPTKESMLLAFEIYRERIVRTAAVSIAQGRSGLIILTSGAFFPAAARAGQPAAAGLRTPHYS